MATRLAASDVAVTILKNRILRGSAGGVRLNTVKLVFGDGSKSYGTSAKIPLPTFPSFGFLRELEFLTVIEAGLAAVNYVWKYDFTNKRLQAFAGKDSGHVHDLLIHGGGTTATGDFGMFATTGVIESEHTADITVTGKATTTAAATSGGVLAASTISGLIELADDTVIAQQTIYAQAWGW
jgi:hypothetical protein